MLTLGDPRRKAPLETKKEEPSSTPDAKSAADETKTDSFDESVVIS